MGRWHEALADEIDLKSGAVYVTSAKTSMVYMKNCTKQQNLHKIHKPIVVGRLWEGHGRR